MTITTETAKSQYLGNGSTAEFSIGFEFLAPEDVKVILTDASDVDTTWVQGTQYNVRNNDGSPIVNRVQPATGKVFVVTAPTNYTPANGTVLTLLRNQALKQTTSYTEQGPFPARAHERALDRLSMQIQKEAEKLTRAPKFRETSQTSDITFPEPDAYKVIAWNAAGDDLENRDAAPGEGDMLASTYDPQGVQDDAFARANHTGTQLANTISNFNSAADARVAAAIGSAVQAYSANLDEWSGINPSANGASLVAAATYAAMRALLDLEAGTDFLSPAAIAAAYQPLDADLTALAALATNAAGRSILTLSDPNADRIAFWDDSAGAFQHLTLGTNLSITGTTLDATGGGGTLGTPVTASGTSVDFSSLPSNAKMIVVSGAGLSFNNNTQMIVQLGDSGGIENTGYLSTFNSGAVTNGIAVAVGTASDISNFALVLILVDSSTNTWIGIGTYGAGSFGTICVGTKSLSGTLDRVRITGANGTSTFDAGKANYLYFT